MDILNSSNKIPTICWEHTGSKNPIYFDGMPYLWLGGSEYQCHQGKDKNASNKLKHALKAGKKKKRTPPASKKIGCPVVFQVKKIFKLLEFKITADTKWQRSVKSKQIRGLLAAMKQNGCTQNEVCGRLQYITQFPEGECYIFHILNFILFLSSVDASCTNFLCVKFMKLINIVTLAYIVYKSEYIFM